MESSAANNGERPVALEAQVAGGWDWNAVVTPKAVISAVVLLAPVVWIYWTDIASWETTWRTNDNWSFGYFILPLGLWLAHMRFMECPPRQIQPCWWGVGLIGFGLLVRLAGVSSMFGYVAQISIIFVLAGIILHLLGWAVMKVAWVPVAYLALGIPWPVRVYDSFAQPLQRFAAWGVEHTLLTFGVAVERAGNLLTLASGPIAVTGLCSGLRLLLAFVALGALIAFISKRATWERIGIVLSTLPIAIFCNCLRVLGMALWSNLWYYKALGATDPAKITFYEEVRRAVLEPGHLMFPGAPSFLDWHSSLGYVMLLLAFVLLWAETQFLDRLFLPDDADAAAEQA